MRTTLAELLLIQNESRKLPEPSRSLYGSNFAHDVHQYGQQLSGDGLPLYGLHYSDYPKWGLNPQTRYFPRGIYFYYLSPKCDAALGNGFGTDRKYANVGRLNLDRFLIINNGHPRHFGKEALDAALAKLQAVYGQDSINHAMDWNGKMEMDGVRKHGLMALELFQVIFGIERRKLTKSFNRALHDAGFDGILDIDGQFLPIESCQGVQTWPGDAVEFIQALPGPYRRGRNGLVRHNPYPEERTDKTIKYIDSFKPGTLKLNDQQAYLAVQNAHKEKQLDVIQSLLHRANLANADDLGLSVFSKWMERFGNTMFDVLERNPTTPKWFWHHLAREGDNDARLAASDQLEKYTLSKTSLQELLLTQNESRKRFGKEKFDMNVLKSLKDIKLQKNYLGKTAMFIGAGSSRIAYAITPKHVVKLAGGRDFAYNASNQNFVEVGIEQNKAEVEGYAKASEEVKQILPRTVGIPGNNGTWIVSELVRPVDTVKELQILAVGNKPIVNGDGEVIDIIDLLQQLYNRTYLELADDPLAHTIQNSDRRVGAFIDSIQKAMDEIGVSVADMPKIEQWGKTADGRAALLDFGGTEDILFKFFGGVADDDFDDDDY